MNRKSRTIGALTLLALVGGGLAWIVLSDGGTRSTTAAPNAAEVSRPPDAGSRRLKLSHRGEPVIWLKRHTRIPIRAAPDGRVVKRLDWQTDFGSRTALAVFRRRGKWAGVPTPLLPNGQLGWVKLDPSRLDAGWTRYLIEIDLSSRSAQLRRGDRVVRSFPVTVGAPGSTTPTGRFAITDTFRGNLNPAYGCCALATTATQPAVLSGWLGGSRIAIHGTVGPVGDAVSHGCVRAANDDVDALVSRVPLGTPVLIHG